MKSNKTEKKVNEARAYLKEISKIAKELVKSEQYDTVNEAIRFEIYQLHNKELKTFKQWLEDGKCVKKGEKGFVFWGAPKAKKTKNKEVAPAEPMTEEEEEKFFPICYLFSEDQVQLLEA